MGKQTDGKATGDQEIGAALGGHGVMCKVAGEDAIWGGTVQSRVCIRVLFKKKKRCI